MDVLRLTGMSQRNAEADIGLQEAYRAGSRSQAVFRMNEYQEHVTGANKPGDQGYMYNINERSGGIHSN